MVNSDFFRIYFSPTVRGEKHCYRPSKCSRDIEVWLENFNGILDTGIRIGTFDFEAVKESRLKFQIYRLISI